jgi:hypothetical protein
MPWSITYSTEAGFLSVNLFGIYTPQDSSQLIADLNQNIIRFKCKQIMVNSKKVQLRFNNSDFFNLPSLFEMMGFARDCKTAILVPKINEDTVFYENVCNNRGFYTKMFIHEKPAEKWLSD